MGLAGKEKKGAERQSQKKTKREGQSGREGVQRRSRRSYLHVGNEVKRLARLIQDAATGAETNVHLGERRVALSLQLKPTSERELG